MAFTSKDNTLRVRNPPSFTSWSGRKLLPADGKELNANAKYSIAKDFFSIRTIKDLDSGKSSSDYFNFDRSGSDNNSPQPALAEELSASSALQKQDNESTVCIDPPRELNSIMEEAGHGSELNLGAEELPSAPVTATDLAVSQADPVDPERLPAAEAPPKAILASDSVSPRAASSCGLDPAARDRILSGLNDVVNACLDALKKGHKNTQQVVLYGSLIADMTKEIQALKRAASD